MKGYLSSLQHIFAEDLKITIWNVNQLREISYVFGF
jgi:hypothetical protein